MSFEQTAFSFAVGQPPTPSRTPTSDPYEDQNAFQTPKVDGSFFDSRGTWDPLDPAHSSSFNRTPKAQNTSLSANTDHLFSTPNLALLSPQMPSPQLPDPEEEERTGSLQSIIQTPPPTNTSGTKRKEKQNSSTRSSRHEGSNRPLLPRPIETGISNAIMASPQQQQQQQQQQQFAVDFGSPGLFGQSLGPATAPLFPQHKPMWDGNIDDVQLDFLTSDFFDQAKQPPLQHFQQHQQQGGLEPFVSSHEGAANLQSTYVDFPGMGSQSNATPSVDSAEMQLQGLGSSVDPSMLFGSARGSLPGPMLDDDSLQPYAYQVQEARRERVYAGISKRRRRKPSVDSPAVAAALESLRDGSSRPGLRRSMTDSFLPRSGRSSSSSSRAGTSHGRSSPLKQIRADAKRRQRTSAQLVIGADGRARVETVVHQDRSHPHSHSEMDVDSSAYSSETDSSETNDDEMNNHNALTTSFGGDMASGGLGRSGRFGPSTGHSQKSSYSSYYSNNSDSSRGKGKGNPSSKRASRHLVLDPVKEGGSFEDQPVLSGSSGYQDSGSVQVGNAQQALMHSLKASQRGRYSPQKQNSGLEPFVSSPGAS